MQRLLEETSLFDLSLEDYDSNFGDRWSTIQAQMNQVLFNKNPQHSKNDHVKNPTSFKNRKKHEQSKISPKLTSPSKQTKQSPTKKTSDERLKLSSYLQTSSKYVKSEDSVAIQPAQNKAKSHSKIVFEKLELALLEKDEYTSEQASEKANCNLPKKEPVVYKLDSPESFLNYSESKKERKQQREISNKKNIKLLNQDLNKLIITKKIHTFSRELVPKVNQKLQNFQRNEYDQPDGIDQSNGSSLTEDMRTSSSVRRKSSFESMENVFKNINHKRRNSIENFNFPVEAKKLKTVKINFRNDLNDKKILELPNITPTKQILHQRKSNQEESYNDPIQSETENENQLQKNKDSQQSNQIRSPLKNLPGRNDDNKTPSHEQRNMKNYNLALDNRRQNQYKHQISDLKEMLKHQKDTIKNNFTERKVSNNPFHLPQLKYRSQSENKQNINSIGKNKKQNFQVQFVKKGSQLNFKILLSKDHRRAEMPLKQTKTQEKRKIKELNLILKKDHQNGRQVQSTKVIRSRNSEPKETHNKTVKKVPLSKILNGKFKIEDVEGKQLSPRKIVSKSCFFTNYKSPIANHELKKKENVNMKDSTVSEGQNLQYQSNLQLNKNVYKITFTDQNPIHSSRNTSRLTIRSKTQEFNLPGEKNIKVNEKENKNTGKSERKWKGKIIEPSKRERIGTVNEDFSIKKNLNVENNISIFKLSLNRNKNKLVIIRK